MEEGKNNLKGNEQNRASQVNQSNQENQLSKLKRKITGVSTKGKVILVGTIASSLLIGTVAGVCISKNEKLYDHAAEEYVNCISRDELKSIAKGYSPEKDEVISDRYEMQRQEGYEIIKEITGLEGLYDQNHNAVSYEDYERVAEEYKAFVKEFAWDNVGQYIYDEEDKSRFCFYIDTSDAPEYTMAIDRYSHTNNEKANDLYVTNAYSVEDTKYLYRLVKNYIDILDSNSLESLRKNLNNAPDIINDVVNQMYYIDEKNCLHELPIEKVQDHAVEEIQDGDYTIVKDENNGTKVILTDNKQEEKEL